MSQTKSLDSIFLSVATALSFEEDRWIVSHGNLSDILLFYDAILIKFLLLPEVLNVYLIKSSIKLYIYCEIDAE